MINLSLENSKYRLQSPYICMREREREEKEKNINTSIYKFKFTSESKRGLKQSIRKI